MKEKIIKLLDVKSLVTLALTAVFSVLVLRRAEIPIEFSTVFTSVIAFYFGTQHEKKKEVKDERNLD